MGVRQWRIVIVKFIETPIFTKQVTTTLNDDAYRALQEALLLRPELGVLIRGSGGLRKVRWQTGQTGRRSGVRIIYYWQVTEETIFLLMIYRKTHQQDLSRDQIKILRRTVEQWLE